MFNFLEKNHGTYNVSVSLRTSSSSTNIVSETKALTNGNRRGIFSLQVPSTLVATGNMYIDVSSDGCIYKTRPLYATVWSQPSEVILIQTDKGVYKAGQTVQFRVISVNRKREVVIRPTSINILDGDGIRIRRWVNVTDNSGVFVGRMEMSEYPVLGTWSINVNSDGISKTKEFEVQSYELPMFDFTINMPEVVTSTDKMIKGKVSSMYTFGTAVSGTVEIIISYTIHKISRVYKLKDVHANIEIHISDIIEGIKINPFASYHSTITILATATVTEELTGNTRKDNVYMGLMSFDISIGMGWTHYFHVGRPFEIKGRLTNRFKNSYDGNAADLYGIRLTILNGTWSSGYNEMVSEIEVPIDEGNHFSFTVDQNLITDQVTSMLIKVRVIWIATEESITTKNAYAYRHKTTTDKPKLQSLLSIKQVNGSNPLNVGETARYRISMDGSGILTALYKVVSKGIVVEHSKWFSISESSPYELDVKATSSMKPLFVVTCWIILPNNHGLTAYYYAMTRRNHVAVSGIATAVKEIAVAQEPVMNFQHEVLQPGENARLNFKSSPGSSFYVLGIDKDVLLMDEENDITETMMPDSYDDRLVDMSFDYTNSIDLVGLLKATNLLLRTFSLSSQLSTTNTSSSYASSSSALRFTSFGEGGLYTSIGISAPPKRRTFPDTWLFLNVSADSNGEASIVGKVPDAITTWSASCFAVSAGSKISFVKRTAELRVYRPFSISLRLPLSVIRNEQVDLEANIFNNHTEDLYVLVTLKKSSQYHGLTVVKRGKRRILEEKCGNVVLCILAKAGRVTAAYFPIKPTRIGNVKVEVVAKSSIYEDTDIKTLRVECEGAPKSIAYPIFIDLTEKRTFEKRLDVHYPSNTVEGSQQMRVSLIGDVMGGPSLDGLERLLVMPYGCGEQNMIRTAPSVFVHRYLLSVGRLTDKIRQKTEQLMRMGIQRQLTYRHTDWSFSAWGGHGSGSTWLTAYVLKVFSIASNYVEIDSTLIAGSTSFLIKNQNSDGSFPEKGILYNRWLQGGADEKVECMTAFVLIALLEARNASPNLESCEGCMQKLDIAIERASNYLANNLDNQTSVYTIAILAYALNLAEHKRAGRARNMLDSLSRGVPGEKFWEMHEHSPQTYFHYGGVTRKSLSVEMTAYGLLSFVNSKSLTKSLPILKWLTRQRNPYGGFISTQDTVIALEAISEMAAKVYSEDSKMSLSLSFSNSQLRKRKFRINAKNAMVMQSNDILTDTNFISVHANSTKGSTSLRTAGVRNLHSYHISTETKSISVHAKGKKGSTAILTVSLFYNIYMDIKGSSLELGVLVSNETTNRFALKSCVEWFRQERSGMIVVEIGIPSGFVANRRGISAHELLKKTEFEDRKVVLYYEEVRYGTLLCTNLHFIRDKMVAQIKPVPCKAYEYYEPSDEVNVFYVPSLAKNANICDLCGIECGCQTTKKNMSFQQSWCKKKIQSNQ